MLRFSGSVQNPCSSVLDELQRSNGLLWKAGEETFKIIHPASDKRHDQVSPNLDWKQKTQFLQCF